ncbi:MAG: (2Fe-2S)-binding protein [Leptospiraceae bacterium]|nr:(2Fe-2S)-binding protein [Leptospiraceae bacterium]NUM42435.1 (2Fe-2S)-binding protein [Leptospiraceae bacterium]
MRPKRVCLCKDVSESELVEAVHSGCDTFEKLVEKTRATTGCGSCAKSVIAILERELQKLIIK